MNRILSAETASSAIRLFPALIIEAVLLKLWLSDVFFKLSIKVDEDEHVVNIPPIPEDIREKMTAERPGSHECPDFEKFVRLLSSFKWALLFCIPTALLFFLDATQDIPGLVCLFVFAALILISCTMTLAEYSRISRKKVMVLDAVHYNSFSKEGAVKNADYVIIFNPVTYSFTPGLVEKKSFVPSGKDFSPCKVLGYEDGGRIRIIGWFKKNF